MRELFTRGLRGEAQKETALGAVPKSWEFITVGKLGVVITGTTPLTKVKEYYEGGEIPFVSPGDMKHGSRIQATEKQITEEGLAVSRPLPAGTTCVVCIGATIGKVGRTTAKVCATNQQINAIVPSTDFDNGYVFYLLDFGRTIFESRHHQVRCRF